MADNSLQGGSDTIRDIDKGGIKTQVFAIDAGGSGVESLVSASNPLPVTRSDCVPVLTATITEVGVSANIDTQGFGAIVVQIYGIWQGNCYFEASNNLTDWDTVLVFSRDNLSLQDILTSGGMYTVRPSGQYLRLNVTNITGSLGINAIGRAAEGIAASDLLSLAMDRQSNAPLNVALMGTKQDAQGALMLADGLAFDGSTTSITVPLVQPFETLGYNSVTVSCDGGTASVFVQFSEDGKYWTAGHISASGAGFSQNAVAVSIASPINIVAPIVGRLCRVMLASYSSGVITGKARLRSAQVYPVNGTNILSTQLTNSSGSPYPPEDSAVGSMPVMVTGGMVRTAVAPTTLIAGDAARHTMSSAAQLIVKDFSVGETDWQYTGILATAVAVAMKAAGAASVRNYCTSISFQNTSAVATTVLLLDGSTVIAQWNAPAAMAVPYTESFPTPKRGTAATAMNINCGTTAANVLVNAGGYQSL